VTGTGNGRPQRETATGDRNGRPQRETATGDRNGRPQQATGTAMAGGSAELVPRDDYPGMVAWWVSSDFFIFYA